MGLHQQASGIQLKHLGLVTLLILGVCGSVAAQTSSTGLPALPPVPSVSTTSLSTFNLPKIPTAAAATPLASPAAIAKTNTNSSAIQETPPENEPATKQTDDPEGAIANVPPMNTSAATPPAGMPSLPMPPGMALPEGMGGGTTTPTASTVSGAPPSIPVAATSLPEIHVEQKHQNQQTTLAPSYRQASTANYHYRRVQLPANIYASQYDKANSHLPVRETREEYEALLFSMVAKNDIEATRALLNAGTGLEATNSYGETPLMVARRTGATEVAQLLTARGASR